DDLERIGPNALATPTTPVIVPGEAGQQILEEVLIFLEVEEAHRILLGLFRHRNRQNHRQIFPGREGHVVNQELTTFLRAAGEEVGVGDLLDLPGKAAHGQTPLWWGEWQIGSNLALLSVMMTEGCPLVNGRSGRWGSRALLAPGCCLPAVFLFNEEMT